MNYRCICKNCGEVYYSAASIENHYEKVCQRCGGQLIQFSQKPKLGEILTALEILNESNLEIALNLQKSLKRRVPLGKILLWLSFVSQRDLMKALEIQKELY